MTTCPCGAALPIAEKPRRPRKYCSAACRYAAHPHTPTPKQATCQECGGELAQPTTGRPRKRCLVCSDLRAHSARVFDAGKGAVLPGAGDRAAPATSEHVTKA